MENRDVVTAFLRHGSDVLLLRRSEAVGSYAGRWSGVSGHADESPAEAVRREIREETGLDESAIDCVRRGESFTVKDADLDIRWTIHPFLFDCTAGTVETNWETDTFEWVAPTAILRRKTVPELWRSYDSVRPTVETVTADERHGSSYLSVRALEVLRDRAALATEGRTDDDWADLSALARDVRAARPSMTVVANRVNRAMSAASDGGRTPAALEEAVMAELERARRAKQAAAETAGEYIAGKTVGTLSRSGTVLAAVETAAPTSVVLAESRPGREGVGVAERLAGTADVTLTTDAAFPGSLLAGAVDVLVVGADTILADGRVCNKVGTAGAAVAASAADVPVYVVASTDKISAGSEVDTGERPSEVVYDGTAAITVDNPTFEVTPPEYVDGFLTDEGRLETADIRSIGEDQATRRDWE